MKILSEDLIKSYCTRESYSRGYRLFKSEMVYNTFINESTLLGSCVGTSAPEYQIKIIIDNLGLQTVECSCLYDWGGICKHIVAVLLTYLHAPEIFIRNENLIQKLTVMEKGEVFDVLSAVMKSYPESIAWINEVLLKKESQQIESGGAETTSGRQISKADFSRKIQYILNQTDKYRPSQAYWMIGGMVEQLEDISMTAYQFYQSGNNEAAFEILTLLYKKTAKKFPFIDDSDGIYSGFLSDLAFPLAEVILCLQSDEKARKKYIKMFAPIIHELNDYGIVHAEIILAALNRGWSDIPLFELEDFYIDDCIFSSVKLNALEKQHKDEEYLQLAQKIGDYLRYVIKLIKLNQPELAVKNTFEKINDANDIFAIAKEFRNFGHQSEALKVAEHGLLLEGRKKELCLWIGPIAEVQHNNRLALLAYQTAFMEFPSLDLYKINMRLAKENWHEIKPILLDYLLSSSFISQQIDILLFEEDWDQAIRIIDKQVYCDLDLLKKVSDAVIKYKPSWVIKVSRNQAANLIDKKQGKYYDYATKWLKKAKKAYHIMDRDDLWEEYLQDLRLTFSRRPALLQRLNLL